MQVFEVRVAKLPSEHPPFVALRPPPRAIWTDVRSCYPWETPPPHPTKNKKNIGNINWVFLSRGEVPKWSPNEAARGPTRGRYGIEKGWPLWWDLWRPHLGTSGGLLGSVFCLLSCLFSSLSSLFALLSPLFSLLSSPCRRGLARHRSPLFSLLSSLCSLPSSLAAAHSPDRTSHLALRTLHQAIASAPNCLAPLRHHPWPGGMRETMNMNNKL